MIGKVKDDQRGEEEDEEGDQVGTRREEKRRSGYSGSGVGDLFIVVAF